MYCLKLASLVFYVLTHQAGSVVPNGAGQNADQRVMDILKMLAAYERNARNQIPQDQCEEHMLYRELENLDSRYIGALNRATLSDDADIRFFAVTGLAHMHEPEALVRLPDLINDKDTLVVIASAFAAGENKDKGSVPALIGRLDNRRGLPAIIQALGQIGDRRAVRPLMKQLSSENLEIQREIVEALGRLGDPHALRVLKSRKWSVGDEVARLQKELDKSIARLGGK